MKDDFGIENLISDVSIKVRMELHRAMKLHGPMMSGHEGYAVILEELEELWDEIKLKKPDKELMREEAIQLAAMAMRFVIDVCWKGGEG